MIQQLHNSIHELNTIAYTTFDTNTPEQRKAFNDAIEVLKTMLATLQEG